MIQNDFPIDIPLSSIRVAKPCRADWDKMQGDDHARFCGSCAKNVYNLSSMTRADAENLIREKEGQLCVRFYQRADGTILTNDCSVGIAEPRKMKFSAAVFTMLLAPLLAVGGAMATTTIDKTAAMNTLRDAPIIGAIIQRFSPAPVITVAGAMAYTPTTGRIAAPPVPVCPTPSPTPEESSEPELNVVMGAAMPPQAQSQAQTS